MPKISVLMPVFNASAYLHEAINSILEQTFTDFEFIIINDGSTDNSEDIILSFSDKRIKYTKNEQNLGIINTLNKGIILAKGEYLARMDSDDISEQNRLKTQFNFLQKNKEIGLCGSWANTINEKGEPIGKIIHQTEPELLKINLLFSVPIIHPSVMGHTSLFKQYIYPNKDVAEDYALWLQLSEKTLLANIPQFLIKYRWHNTNVSKEKYDIQIKSKINVIYEALSRLELNPSEEEIQTHILSFNLYGLESNKGQYLNESILEKSSIWFSKLIASNDLKEKYNQSMFKAFLWGRWIVLCLATKRKDKILFPPFKTLNPKVILYLFKQILLLSQK